ncbi:hypothetical protein NEOLI_003567 [Neolecta irregularis DAH-3]|uniref:Uncharacterized protein n=1 Tax=Neolecta irregularis (strain DAH-3) TaxID=1198029 RepID=A0A1U7LTC5_NEOID|nr:hypothetical protein NEOLI_003567 [Neolecta irregularis DAH-3]|eukprot:OLL25926.1 hypothetical protein NEOLI_003567 [Neolecta irregularis DAH-3]
MIHIISFSILAVALAKTDFQTCVDGAKPFVKSYKACLTTSKSDEIFRDCICTDANKAEISVCAKAIPSVPALADYFGEMDISKVDDNIQFFCSAPINMLKEHLNIKDLREELKESTHKLCTVPETEMVEFLEQIGLPESEILDIFKELCPFNEVQHAKAKNVIENKENKIAETVGSFSSVSAQTTAIATRSNVSTATPTETKVAKATSGAIVAHIAGLVGGVAALGAML